MIFRQLFDQVSSTYTYLLGDDETREAVLIDPVFEQHARDAALVRELGLKLLYTLDTHCHADHVTGAWLLRAAVGSKIALSKAYGASNVDVPLSPGEVVRFGRESLTVLGTPGHTQGCLSFSFTASTSSPSSASSPSGKMVFTGDALLVRGTGRTDFQGGDAATLFRSIKRELFSLPESTLVYPAHDYEGRTLSTIGEEVRYNPRLGGNAPEEDFIGYVRNLGLPHPKQLAVAVPANMRAGQPEDGKAPRAPDWGPVVTTYAGLPEIAPEWVASHRRDVVVVDVRMPSEFEGELGHLEGAKLIPLDELRGRIAEVPRGQPVVVVCQTGRRSGMGAVILGEAGIDRVANLAGGMVGWRELGLPS
jgi:glyoxylase-like metal-dependent hydrolase (beta-lactamase superfamily II)/rhodanese-related sulfurtransferase